MAVLVDAQPISIAPGSREFVAVHDGGGGVLVIRLARQTTATPTLWPAGVSISGRISVSFTGGTTWRPYTGFTAVGGIVPAREGGDLAETSVRTPVPPGANRVRLELTVAGGTLNSLLTVEMV